jgi:uncharacterized protein
MSPDETLLTFPCQFPIKIMGKNEAALEKLVAETIRAHSSDFDPATISVRESNGGKFLSVTAVFTAHSKQQIDAIYKALTGNPAVLMAL